MLVLVVYGAEEELFPVSSPCSPFLLGPRAKGVLGLLDGTGSFEVHLEIQFVLFRVELDDRLVALFLKILEELAHSLSFIHVY